MALARKIAYNVILNSFFKVFSTVALSLFSIRLITGYLGQEGFGKYATVLAFFAFFSAVADLGLASVTAREISRDNADEENILGNVISLRLITSFLLFALSPLIILFFSYSPDVEVGIIIAGAAILFSTLSLVLNGIFQKNLAMHRVAMIEFCGKVLQVAAVFLAVQQDWGFLAIAATLLVSLSFNAVATFLASRRYTRFRLRFDSAFWKTFLRESYPMGVTAIISFTYFKMDTILLSLMQSQAHVGIYNVAYKIMENLIFFPAMLAGLILPLLSRSIFTDRNRFEEIANKTFKVFFIIIVPLIIGTLFLAQHIVTIVSGPEFQESVLVLRILIFALGFIFFGHYFNMLLVVGNAQRKLMQSLLVAAVVNIGLNLILIERFSYLGAASTAVVTELVVVLLTFFLTRKYIGFRPSFENTGRIVLSGITMALVLFWLEPISFFLAGFAGVSAYLLVLWLTKAVSASELASLFSRREEPATVETPLT